MSCNVDTLLAQAAANQFFSLQDRELRIAILQLLCSSSAVSSARFTSQNITLTNSAATYTVAHGLSSTPAFVRPFLLCITADAAIGCVPGDEIDLWGCFNQTQASPAFGLYVNSTSVIITIAGNPLVGNEADYAVPKKANGALFSPTSFSNFALKFVAST